MSSQLTFLRHQIDVLHIKVTYYTNTESIPISIYTQTHTYKTHSVEQKNLEHLFFASDKASRSSTTGSFAVQKYSGSHKLPF